MRGGRYESMDGGAAALACRLALDVLELAQRPRPLSLTNVNQIKVRRLWSVKTCDISCGVSKRVGNGGRVVSCRPCLLVSAVELSKPTALLVRENAPSGVNHVSIGESSSRGWLVRGALVDGIPIPAPMSDPCGIFPQLRCVQCHLSAQGLGGLWMHRIC